MALTNEEIKKFQDDFSNKFGNVALKLSLSAGSYMSKISLSNNELIFVSKLTYLHGDAPKEEATSDHKDGIKNAIANFMKECTDQLESKNLDARDRALVAGHIDSIFQFMEGSCMNCFASTLQAGRQAFDEKCREKGIVPGQPQGRAKEPEYEYPDPEESVEDNNMLITGQEDEEDNNLLISNRKAAVENDLLVLRQEPEEPEAGGSLVFAWEYQPSFLRDHDREQEIPPHNPTGAQQAMLANLLARAKKDGRLKLDGGEIPCNAFSKQLGTFLKNLNDICEVDRDPATGARFSPSARLEMMQQINKYYHGLQSTHLRNNGLEGDERKSVSRVIAEAKIRFDDIRAQMEKKVEETTPNSPLLNSAREDPFHPFCTPGTKEANDLKFAYEMSQLGSASITEVFNASWNYLRQKDTTPWTTFGKERVKAAANLMADKSVELLDHVLTEDQDLPFGTLDAMQEECLRSHEFRAALVKELPSLIRKGSKDALLVYYTACNAEKLCPGKNGPITGKLPTDSVNESRARSTVMNIRDDFDKHGMNRLNPQEKEDILNKLYAEAFPAPKVRAKTGPAVQKSGSVSQKLS